jgi:hypothetical protein
MSYKRPKKLLNFNNHVKMIKSRKQGFLNAILHLAPYNLSGYNVCPEASKGCAAACLNLSGMGVFKVNQLARINKTKYFIENRELFLNQLDHEIKLLKKKSKLLGLKLAIRLNGTSDLPFERYKIKDNKSLMELNKDVIFYDYTKIKNRLNSLLPNNYKLTFSRSESNDHELKDIKQNIAVVFKNKLPKKYLNKKVIDGDEHDLRFLDPKNSIVGLLAKGKAKKDNSNFAIEV